VTASVTDKRDPRRRNDARALSLQHGSRRATTVRHVRPPTSPTTRAAASPEKARPQRMASTTTMGIKRPGPLPSKRDPRAARALGSKNLTLEGCDYRSVGPRPARRERAPQMPSIQRITDQQLKGWFDRALMSPADVKKTGAPSCYPAMALLIRGSKSNPRRVRTGAPDQQSQGRQGHAHSCLSSSPPAQGCPTCHVQEPTKAASRRIPPRESFRALGPHRMGPSPTYHTRVKRFHG
jgi:hypothetical protein